jgi:epoxyqueuosine reductase
MEADSIMPAHSAEALTSALKTEAGRLGFDLVGVAPALSPPSFPRFRQWLADGFAADMRFLSDRADSHEHPDRVLQGVKSILVLGTNYRTSEPVAPAAGEGRVSRYAWGLDYHDLIRARLHELADFHRRLAPDAPVRGIVDTAPLLEREFGRLAGLGWIGKNTMLINDRFGSWFFLAALLSGAELLHDLPDDRSRCGNCRACLDACPTGALVEPFRLDSRKCISYLTIESRGDVPAEYRKALGNRLFGCDACQEACPWNRRTPPTGEPSLQPLPGMNPVNLRELIAMDQQALKTRFRHTALWRAKPQGILRTAAILLASNNSTTPKTIMNGPSPSNQRNGI